MMSGSAPLPPPSSQVTVVDEQTLLVVLAEDIRSIARLALDMEGSSGNLEVALVDDATIGELHGRFLGDSDPTDVITFPHGNDEIDPLDPEAAPVLGEIVVSTETAIRQAPDFLEDPVLETLCYVVHGVLHLVGHDDREEAAAARMEARQQEILDQWRQAHGR